MISTVGMVLVSTIGWLEMQRTRQRSRARPVLLTILTDEQMLQTQTKAVSIPFWEDARQQQLQAVASPLDEITQKGAAPKFDQNLMIASISLGLAAVGGLGFPMLTLLSLPGFFYIMKSVMRDSYKTLVKKRKLTVDTMGALTKIMLFISGQFLLSNVSIFLYVFNRKLLSAIKDNTRNNMVDVFRQQPRMAWVLVDGVEVERPCSTLAIGDVVVVHAGETIPVDGSIMVGTATVDQRMLTGEAQPAEKEVGTPVFALTTVISGRICIGVEKTGEETTAAQIGQILNRTVDGKTDLQFWVEAMLDKTVAPSLLIGAGALPFVGFTVATSFLYAHPNHKTSICVSLDIMNFLNLAARQGLLMKDGRTFELLNKVDTFVFDKTGTLTDENPHVGQIYACAGYDETAILRYAAAAESNQTHPIATAIRQASAARAVSIPTIDAATYAVGYGLSVLVECHQVQVGSARFMEREGLVIPDLLSAAQANCHAYGHSLVLVSIDGAVVGAIELRATIRPEAKATIHALRQRGIKSIYIISGDHTLPTQKLAAELGIDAYFAETLPEEKATIIEQLQQTGKRICYVGDGINDAIALKQASVSISLRGASTVATDAAQVILMDQSLRHLGDLLDLAREYQSHVKRTFLAVLLPHLVGMAGVLFFHFGLVPIVILANLGLFAGVTHAISPWTRPNHRALLEKGQATTR